MVQHNFRLITAGALRYHPHTRCHEVSDNYNPVHDLLDAAWVDENNVIVRDTQGGFVAQGAFVVRTFSDVQGVSTGQRAQLDRCEIDGVAIGYGVDADLVPGEQYRVVDSAVASAIPALPAMGFAPGTMIATPSGADPVEWLEAGVLIDTLDSGPQPLRAVLRCPIPTNRTHEVLTIAAGELEAHCPESPLSVAQNQPILLISPMADLYFGSPDVLAAARHVTVGAGVPVTLADGAVLTVLIFDDPQIICAEGAWVSSHVNTPAAIARLSSYLSAQDIMMLRQNFSVDAAPRPMLGREEAALVRPIPHARIAAGRKIA